MNATERIINLALLLGSNMHASRIVSTEQIRHEIYPRGQSDHAFEKMFARDKEILQLAGLVIQADSWGSNQLIIEDTFCDIPELSSAERATLALVGFAQLNEPLFPLPFALRLALTKLSRLIDEESALALRSMPASSSIGARDTETANSDTDTSLYLELLLHACKNAQLTDINYTNAAGTKSERTIAPYGMYLLSGCWYIVALDQKSNQTRTFKLGRISKLTLTEQHFEPPADFSSADWISLPFEIASRDCDTANDAPAEASSDYTQTTIVIPASHPTNIDSLTKGRGHLAPQANGSYLWRIGYRNLNAFITFVLENNLHFACPQHHAYAVSTLEAMVSKS